MPDKFRKPQDRLEFHYTDLEWELAERNAIKFGYKSLAHYLTKQITRLKDMRVTDEELDRFKTKSKRRVYYPTQPSVEILKGANKRTGISPTILVSRLLINPLLNHNL